MLASAAANAQRWKVTPKVRKSYSQSEEHYAKVRSRNFCRVSHSANPAADPPL